MTKPPAQEREITRRKRRAAQWSLVSNSFLIALKMVVGVITGSVGVLAELVNSAADLMGSLVVYLSVRASDEPPDETHDYGHGKIENLSGVATASLILAGGLYAIWQALSRLFQHVPIEHLDLAMATMGVSALMNLYVSRYLLRVGCDTDSPALIADGRHLQTDVLTSLGVFAGLGMAVMTGQSWWDAAAAICVSALILRMGYDLAHDSVRNLSDATLPEEERQILIAALQSHPAVLGHHKLRTRKAGSHRHADVHVQIADTHTFVEAHRITEELEDRLRESLPNLYPIIHIEPYDDEEHHQREHHGVEL